MKYSWKIILFGWKQDFKFLKKIFCFEGISNHLGKETEIDFSDKKNAMGRKENYDTKHVYTSLEWQLSQRWGVL